MPREFRRVRRVHGIESVMHRAVDATDIGDAQEVSTLFRFVVTSKRLRIEEGV